MEPQSNDFSNLAEEIKAADKEELDELATTHIGDLYNLLLPHSQVNSHCIG